MDRKLGLQMGLRRDVRMVLRTVRLMGSPWDEEKGFLMVNLMDLRMAVQTERKTVRKLVLR